MNFFSNNSNYDVIIIGGGISGLFTGYKLLNTGLKILIIESSSRLGGRIHTLYKKKLQYESGAARFHSTHTKLLTLINELDLMEDIIDLDDNIKYILRNRSEKYNYETDNHLDLYELLDLSIQNKNKLSKDKLINISFYQYLILLFDYETAQYIKDSFGYDSEIINLNAYSAIEMFKNDLLREGQYYTLRGGLSQIINILEEKINIHPNITIKKQCSLKEINKGSIITDNNDKYDFEKLILTIPSEKLKEINYFKDNQLFNSVKPIKLLRIYAQYPIKNLWFKDIQRTITDNYIRHIIPIDYNTGLIMISYTDDKYSELLHSYSLINEGFLIKALHKEINHLFGISPPKPKMISIHYWENGMHLWKKGYDMDSMYDSIIQPDMDEQIFIVGESFSKKQGWIEGALETCNNMKERLSFNGFNIIKEVGKSPKKNIYKDYPYFTLQHVIDKGTWIILDHDGTKSIYDISKWLNKHPGGDIIYEGINSNHYYDLKKRKTFSKSPYSIFKSLHSNNILEEYILSDNIIKKVGYLKI